MKGGGTGCISATANINPAAIHRLYEGWQSEDADLMQAELNTVRSIGQKYPMIPALKATIANFRADPQWQAVRPPLLPLSDDLKSVLINDLRTASFDMPGLSDQ